MHRLTNVLKVCYNVCINIKFLRIVIATVITKSGNSITIQTTIKLTGSVFEMETVIQSRGNEVGIIATGEFLSSFDATGSQINIAILS